MQEVPLLEAEIPGTSFEKYNSTTCKVVINAATVVDWRSVITCEVYKADGTLLATCQDSIESYINRNQANANLGELLNAVAKYTEAARFYLLNK